MGSHSRRSMILEAAARLFGHYGPTKTTVADIARAARVGVGTVYLEFANKDELLAALSRAHHDRVLQAVEAAWGAHGSVPQRLEAALTARFEAFWGCGREAMHGPQLFRCAGCEAIERAHEAFVERERQLFARFLAEGAEARALAIEHPALDAAALLEAYASFAPPLLWEASSEELRIRLRRTHRIVLYGLLVRP
ncbi:MAG: TetR/AcrR family transcriptional regulator [Sandaracinaceae bacterium]